MFLLSQKYSPKEILGDARLKKEMHAQINALLIACANTCAKTQPIFFNEPGAGEATPFKVIFPLPPTIYEIYKQYVSIPENAAAQDVDAQPLSPGIPVDSEVMLENINVEKVMFTNVHTDTSESGLLDKYRLYAFKTLKKLGLTVIQNTYAPERIDRIIRRVAFIK